MVTMLLWAVSHRLDDGTVIQVEQCSMRLRGAKEHLDVLRLY